jgi:hypothetical protein
MSATILGRRVVHEGRVEDPVRDEPEEAGEEEADSDLLPEHLPVAAKVVRDVRPRGRRYEPVAQRQRALRGVVLVAATDRLRMDARLRLDASRDE